MECGSQAHPVPLSRKGRTWRGFWDVPVGFATEAPRVADAHAHAAGTQRELGSSGFGPEGDTGLVAHHCPDTVPHSHTFSHTHVIFGILLA